MSDTPRVDALVTDLVQWQVVDAGEARKIERELAAMTAERDRWHEKAVSRLKLYGDKYEECADVKMELNEARQSIVKWMDAWQERNKECAELRQLLSDAYKYTSSNWLLHKQIFLKLEKS